MWQSPSHAQVWNSHTQSTQDRTKSHTSLYFSSIHVPLCPHPHLHVSLPHFLIFTRSILLSFLPAQCLRNPSLIIAPVLPTLSLFLLDQLPPCSCQALLGRADMSLLSGTLLLGCSPNSYIVPPASRVLWRVLSHPSVLARRPNLGAL